jgi:chorismate lyase
VSLQDFSTAAAEPLLALELWLPGELLLRGIPGTLAAWLSTPGLLTERIKTASGAAAGLRLLDQRLGFLGRDQQALLEAPAASCLVREVALTGAGRPWVFAQSLIPDHTLELHPWLAELGEASLGATLAAFPGVERGPFEFAPLPPAHPLAARAIEACREEPAVLWARRSWFGLKGRRLLVHELFLSAATQC